MTSQALAVIANIVIALAYVGNGVYIAPRFVFGPTPSPGARIARLAGTLFFVLCALTHFKLALHAISEDDGTQGDWLLEWHGHLIHVVQGLAGWAFLTFSMLYLDIRIRPKNRTEVH